MIRIGIIGAGIRGRMFADALAELPDVTVVGAAEPNKNVAAAFTAGVGAPIYATAAELYDAHALDAAIIATPDFAHEEAAVAAAERGIHLLIEKPLTTSVASAYAIADAAARSGSLVVTAFENRLNPPFMEARAVIEAGEIGDIQSQYAQLSTSTFVPLKMLTWAGKSTPTWFLIAHILDLVMLFADKRVASVYASGSKKILVRQGIDTLDAVQAVVRFDDDTTAVLDSSWTLPDGNMPSDVPFRFEVRGEKGTISIDLAHQSIAVSGANGYRWPRTYFPVIDGRLEAFPAWMVRKFVENVRDGSKPDVGIEHALAVTEVQAAIELSIAERRAIDLPSSRPVLGAKAVDGQYVASSTSAAG